MCASWGLGALEALATLDATRGPRGTGTLLCATTALGNALLFHDLDPRQRPQLFVPARSAPPSLS